METTTATTNTYRIDCPGWVPTPLNQLMTGHWAKRLRRKKGDRAVIGVRAWIAQVPPATGRRRVSLHVTLPKGQRRWDSDCFWKTVLDSLVAAELLIDDGPKWCEVGPVSYERTGVLSTTITLEDLPPENTP